MEDFAWRAALGYKDLRRGLPAGSQMLVIGGVVQTLFWVAECLDALEERVPSIPDVRVAFNLCIEAWRLFRDDAAHVADRILRESPPRKHDAIHSEVETMSVISILSYNFHSDTLSTGPDVSPIVLNDEILNAYGLCDMASRRVVEELRSGVAGIPPPPVFDPTPKPITVVGRPGLVYEASRAPRLYQIYAGRGEP